MQRHARYNRYSMFSTAVESASIVSQTLSGFFTFDFSVPVSVRAARRRKSPQPRVWHGSAQPRGLQLLLTWSGPIVHRSFPVEDSSCAEARAFFLIILPPMIPSLTTDLPELITSCLRMITERLNEKPVESALRMPLSKHCRVKDMGSVPEAWGKPTMSN